MRRSGFVAINNNAPFTLERTQILEAVERFRLVVVGSGRVVRDATGFDVLERVLLQHVNVFRRRAHVNRNLQLVHPLQRVLIVLDRD